MKPTSASVAAEYDSLSEADAVIREVARMEMGRWEGERKGERERDRTRKLRFST